MSDYFAKYITFSAENTAERVVDAVDFDRHVKLYADASQVAFGFTDASCTFLAPWAYPAGVDRPLSFVLPANTELWGIKLVSASRSLVVLVTGVH
jgi:hypothetical protein